MTFTRSIRFPFLFIPQVPQFLLSPFPYRRCVRILGIFNIYFFGVALLPHSPQGEGRAYALPSRHVLSSGGLPWLWAGPRGTRRDPACGSSTQSCFGFLIKIKN